MVDLYTQHNRLQPKLNEAINEVLETTSFIKGPQVSRFEDALSEYLKIKNVISCGNGTDALMLALMALELSPGDEVITTDFTFVSSAEVIAVLGLTPVLVDVDFNTFNISVEAIEKAITPKTKAIIPVHLFGQSADMETIMALAKSKGIYVIEDVAQALGAEYNFSDGTVKKAGTIGDIGCTSFFPSKNLGCAGDGGALFTNNEILGSKIKAMANHGMNKQYVYDNIGINSRLDSIQAAILNVKLEQLDDFNLRRKKAADLYRTQLEDIEEIKCPFEVANSSHIYHQFTITTTTDIRDKLANFLNDKGIPTKVYYPIPLHKHDVYARISKFDTTLLTNSVSLSERVLSLPMHTELDINQIDFICNSIKDFINIK